MFSTYSALIGETQANTKYRSRLKQLLQWCGEDFDGVVSFHCTHYNKHKRFDIPRVVVMPEPKLSKLMTPKQSPMC